jgi:hypothetical protein
MQNKKLYIIGALAVLVVVAAAFIAGRLLNGGMGSVFMNLPFLGNMMGAASFSLKIDPAPELPTADPDVAGMLSERKDNSLFVGSGNGVLFQSGDGTSTSSVTVVGGDTGGSGEQDTKKTEVLVTKDTKLYRDATDFSQISNGGETTIQQKVEPGSLDEISNNAMLMVWGRKNGDRVIADVISYSLPIALPAQ